MLQCFWNDELSIEWRFNCTQSKCNNNIFTWVKLYLYKLVWKSEYEKGQKQGVPSFFHNREFKIFNWLSQRYVTVHEVTFLSSNKKKDIQLTVNQEIIKIDILQDIAHVISKVNHLVKSQKRYFCFTFTFFFFMTLSYNYMFYNIIMFVL